MWDRYSDPKEARAFMEHVAREVSMLRNEVNELLHEIRRAQYVRERLDRERPGYWDDSIRLGQVRREFEKAR